MQHASCLCSAGARHLAVTPSHPRVRDNQASSITTEYEPRRPVALAS
jgi:hypothetical protein